VRSVALLALLGGCNLLWADDYSFEPLPVQEGAGGTPAGVGGLGGAGALGGGGGSAGMKPTGCDDDGDCDDGNPCTRNTCADGAVCKVEDIAVGEPGTDEGSCDGACQTDGACGLSLYARAWLDRAAPFERTPLSLAWTGPNAPPPRGILAADINVMGTRLWVFTAEAGGTVYQLAGGTWTRSATDDVFEGVDGSRVNSAVSYRESPLSGDTLFITTRGMMLQKLGYYFAVADGGDAVPDQANPYSIEPDDDPDAALQHVLDCDWEIAVQTGYIGLPSWVVFWRSFAGQVYSFDGGSFDWESYGPDTGSELWAPDGSGPAADSTVAAYYHAGELTLIAP
jgi:hypothetical protein